MNADLANALAEEAARWLYVRETAPNKGTEVEMFQRALDGKATQESWCMAFVQYCVQQVAVRTGAEIQLFPVEHCLTVWQKASPDIKRAAPAPGLIVIWRHGQTSNGHTGIVTDVVSDGLLFSTIEGNTGPGSGVEREGDGVYRKTRHTHPVGEMQIVGYLVPLSEPGFQVCDPEDHV